MGDVESARYRRARGVPQRSAAGPPQALATAIGTAALKATFDNGLRPSTSTHGARRGPNWTRTRLDRPTAPFAGDVRRRRPAARRCERRRRPVTLVAPPRGAASASQHARLTVRLPGADDAHLCAASDFNLAWRTGRASSGTSDADGGTNSSRIGQVHDCLAGAKVRRKCQAMPSTCMASTEEIGSRCRPAGRPDDVGMGRRSRSIPASARRKSIGVERQVCIRNRPPGSAADAWPKGRR